MSAIPGVSQHAKLSNTSSLYTPCLCKQTHKKITEDTLQWALENILDKQQKPKSSYLSRARGVLLEAGSRVYSVETSLSVIL